MVCQKCLLPRWGCRLLSLLFAGASCLVASTRNGLRYFSLLMTTNFYQSVACIIILTGVSSCQRSSYQFTASAAYLPASAVAPPLPVATRAELPQLAHRVPAPLPALRPNHAALPQAPLRQWTSQLQLPKQKKILVAGREPAQSTAGAGPYFSGADFGLILAFLALYALLVTALIAGAIALLVKLILHFTRGRTRRTAQPLGAPQPAP
jgi:hypothetical protein